VIGRAAALAHRAHRPDARIAPVSAAAATG
jgi:hypothetical protein